MKRISFYAGGILFMAWLISSCGAATGGGPQAWIDQPLEAHNPIPFGPITLQAHASDSDGVASLEFSIDDQLIHAVNAGGGRLGQAAVQWEPPGPGTYTFSVRGVDNAGQTGNAASSILIVGEQGQLASSEGQPEEPQEPAATEAPPEQTKVPVQTESAVMTEAPALTKSPVETETPQVDESPAEEPPTSSRPVATTRMNSNCREGPASGYKIEAILLEGQKAPIVGRSADKYWLVVSVEEESEECWIAANLVEVQGDIDTIAVVQPPPLPITDTPTPSMTSSPTPTETATPTLTHTPSPTPSQPPPPPPPPPPDTTPPTITSILIFFPNPIYHGNCPDDPTTSSYSLMGVYDESGIAHVEASWTLGDESGTVVFETADGTNFGAVFGPFYALGEVNMYGSVVDNAGNWTPFTGTLTVKSCIE